MGCCTSGQKPYKKVLPSEPEVTGNMMSMDIVESLLNDGGNSPAPIIHNLPQGQESMRYQLAAQSIEQDENSLSVSTTPMYLKRREIDDPLRKPITKMQNYFD